MSENILQIENMNTEILNEVSLCLKKGEVHSIIGLGSSGKRHLIDGFIGKIEIKGDIYYKNEPVQFDLLSLKEKSVDFIYNTSVLYKNFSVAENIAAYNYPLLNYLPLINYKKVNKKGREVLDKLNFDFDCSIKVKNLPIKEQKIINIAKVFMNEPEVIIMHEPTEELDGNYIKLMNEFINEFKDKGGSILYISRQWEEALKITDRISVLFEGRIIGTQQAQEAKENPKRLMDMINGGRVFDRESELKEGKSSKFLDGVYKAAEYLTSKYELEDVLKLLAEHVIEIMNADGCRINLLEETTKEIIDTVNYTKTDNIKAVMKKDVISEILKNNDIYYATVREKGFHLLFENINNVKTVICVPVFIRSLVTGFVQVYYQDIYTYSEKESKYLSTLAREAAIAIENTKLMGKSALLQESHHRIKNNLQYIISLIKLQKDFTDGKSIEDVLANSISRIKSIASVHDLLSKGEFGKSIINAKELINTIIDFLKNDKIKIISELDDIFIAYNRASAIALVINELLNNSIEHAFKDQKLGIIKIVCSRQNDSIYLTVNDNGQGFSDNFDFNQTNSLGLTIIHSIVIKQFRGEINLYNEGGAKIEIILPL